MKFNKVLNLFIALTVTASAYGANDIDEIHRRHRRQCEAQLANYQECSFSVVNQATDQVKQNCKNIYNTTKCQNFYSNPQAVVPNCYLSGAIGRYAILNNLAENTFVYDIACSSCPIADFLLNPSMAVNNVSSFNQLVKRNCQSSQCNEAFKQYLPYLIDTLNQDFKDQFIDIYNYVNSNECKNGGKPVSTIKTTTTVKKITTVAPVRTTTTTTVAPVRTTTTTPIPVITTTTTTPVPVIVVTTTVTTATDAPSIINNVDSENEPELPPLKDDEDSDFEPESAASENNDDNSEKEPELPPLKDDEESENEPESQSTLTNDNDSDVEPEIPSPNQEGFSDTVQEPKKRRKCIVIKKKN